MAQKGLDAFTTDLKEWVKKNPGKRASLCGIVGTKFSSAGPNPHYRNNELYRLLQAKTDYVTTARLHNVIHAGQQKSTGRIETHIALYYLAKIDETYRAYVPDIESSLFGQGRTFYDVFGWSPGVEETASTNLKPTTASFTKTTLRLRLPGLHSHLSHFSNRTVRKVIGREREQATLHRFVEPTPGFRWLQLAGDAGQGKSRLAYDLIEHVGEFWTSGFLERDELARFQGGRGQHRAETWTNWSPDRPHLIVVDYILGQEAEVGYAMNQMADRSASFEVPIRILLVERQAWNRGELQRPSCERIGDESLNAFQSMSDWFTKLNGRDEHGGRWRNDLRSSEFLYAPGVLLLDNLSPSELLGIVRTFCDTSVEAQVHFAEANLNLHSFEALNTPLLAHFLAEAVSKGEYSELWQRTRLLEYAFSEHIRKCWNPLWGSCPRLRDDHPALRLALLATINRSVDTLSLKNDWQRDGSSELVRVQALALTGSPVSGSVVGVGTVISGLQPDILGEWFVLQALQSDAEASALIYEAFEMEEEQASEFLLRLTQDFPAHQMTERLVNLCWESSRWREHTGLAMAFLGAAYELGHKGPVDYVRALECFRKADIVGEVEARLHIALYLYGGLGVRQNKALAIKIFNQLIADGQTEALCRLAFTLSGDASLGTRLFSARLYALGAKSGYGPALRGFGEFHLLGLGTQKNKKLGLWLITEAAELGDADAMFTLSVLYTGSMDVEEDQVQAVKWCRRAAEMGHVAAMTLFGRFNISGYGCNVNPRGAFKWFSKAAQAGSTESLFCLADCYAGGVGCERDESKALILLKKAVEAGYPEALYAYGGLLELGLGFSKDLRMAETMYRLALSAKYQVGENARSELEAGLLPLAALVFKDQLKAR